MPPPSNAVREPAALPAIACAPNPLLETRAQVSFLHEAILPIVYGPIFLCRRNLEMIVRDESHMP
jgi:hypothetical protein